MADRGGFLGLRDFLLRTRKTLAHNQRMAMMLKNVERLAPEARRQITTSADLLRQQLGIDRVDRGG